MMSKNRLNPWAGLASYEDPEFAEHKMKFCGRDAETYDVARLIHNNVFVTLYGKSGIGKTSLLNAGVFPELREESYIPLSIRLGIRDFENRLSFQTVIINAIELAVKAEIVDVIPEQDDDQSSDFLWSYFARHRFYNKYDEQIVPVIVLDQFEEVFRNDREETQVLLRQLDYLNDKDHRLDNCEVDGRPYRYEQNYRFLVSIREDDLYRLEDSLDNCYLPALKRCRYRLRSLTDEGARDVVLTPGEGLFRPEEQENIVRKVLDIARVKEDNTISTNLLSLVCNRVFNEFKKSGIDHITIPFVESFMKGNPIERFYSEATAGFSESEKEYIETHFIDSAGRRNSVSEADFLSKVPKGRKLLEGDSRILQRLSSGSDARNCRVELIHDSFCEPIALQKEKREKKKRSRQLALLGSAFALCLLVIAFVIFLIYNAKQANWKMMEIRARFVAAEMGQQFLDEHNIYYSISLALENLPDNLKDPDKPYVPEVEALLRRALAEDYSILKGHTNSITSVSFSNDGEFIISGSSDCSIRVWDAKTGIQRGRPLCGHTFGVTSVALSPDGNFLVSSSVDRTIRIWDINNGDCCLTCNSDGSIYSVSFNGKYIVAGSTDGTIRILDVDTGIEACPPLVGHTSSVNSVTFSPDGRYIVSGSSDKTIRLWDTSTGVEVCPSFEGHTSSVNSVSFSPDGRYIVSGSSDETIRIWDASTGVEMCPPFKRHTSSVNSVSFSPDGRYIVSGSSDKTIRLWDASTGVEVCPPLEGHTSSVESVSFSPDGRFIASGSADRTVRVWDINMNLPNGILFEIPKFYASSIAFNIDCNRVMMFSYPGTVDIWDIKTGNQVCSSVKYLTTNVTAQAFSHDDKRVVAASVDGTIYIWNVSPRLQLCLSMTGHSARVNSVAFSPDGRYIVSSSSDKTIRLWDASTGFEMCPPFEGHTSSVNSVSFSPDGRYIVSGSDDKTIRRWDFPPLQELIDQTRERFKDRQLTSEEMKMFYLD